MWWGVPPVYTEASYCKACDVFGPPDAPCWVCGSSREMVPRAAPISGFHYRPEGT